MLFFPRDNKFLHRFLSMTGVCKGINIFYSSKSIKGMPHPKREGKLINRKRKKTFVLHHSPSFNKYLLILRKYHYTLARKRNSQNGGRGHWSFNVESLKNQNISFTNIKWEWGSETYSPLAIFLKRVLHWIPF